MAKKVNTDLIKKLLKETTHIKNNVSLIVLEINPEAMVAALNTLRGYIEGYRVFEMVVSQNTLTILCDDVLALEITNIYKKHIIDYRRGLSALTMIHPEKAIDTPGVLAHTLKLLADANINIIGIISCYKDISLIIKRDDAFKAKELLEKL